MLRHGHGRGALELAVDQHAAAADQDHRHGRGRRLHAVDRVFGEAVDLVHRGRDEFLVELRDAALVADVGIARSNRDVGRRELAAAEHERLARDPVADGTRPDADLAAFRDDQAAAAEADGDQVRHAEVRAHAADVDRDRRFARGAVDERADVGRRAADVHDQRLGGAGEVARAAHAVGRARGEGQHGIARDHVRVEQRAVVLAHIERSAQAEVGQRPPEGFDDPPRHRQQRRVHHGRVLALDQADAADVAGQRDERRGQLLLQDVGRFLLLRRVDGREHGGDGDGLDAAGRELARGALHFGGIERRDRAAVVVEAAADDLGVAVDGLAQRRRPVGHRPDGERRRRAEAQHADAAQVLGFDQRIGEVRRADHHGADGGGRELGGLQDLGDRADDAAADIRRGRRLVAREHGAAAQEHGIGVRAAHVDANPQHFGHQPPATEARCGQPLDSAVAGQCGWRVGRGNGGLPVRVGGCEACCFSAKGRGRGPPAGPRRGAAPAASGTRS